MARISGGHPIPDHWPAGFLAGLFLAIALPFMVIGWSNGRGADDQIMFHEPAIRTFAAELPWPTLSDYSSATAPGYHLVLAAFARIFTDERLVLQFAGSLFTAGLLWTLGASVARRCARADPGAEGAIRSVVLCLPVLASMYVLFPGIWLQPDNAGWLGVLGMLLLALRPVYTVNTLLLGGCLLTALVWTRQNHIWTAALLWAWAYLTAADTPDSRVRTLVSSPEKRFRRTGAAVLVSLPAFMVLGFLVWRWGGLVPPSFSKQHGSGVNFATPPFVLSLAGVYGLFFAGWTFAGLSLLWREHRSVLVLLVLLATVSAVYPPTTYLYEARGTGLWNIVKAMEDRGLVLYHHTSPLLLVLAPIGIAMLAAMVIQLRPRSRWVFIIALCAFTAAQSANSNAWQRYIEPFLLMVFALAAAEIGRPQDPFLPAPIRNGLRASRWVGPLALAALLGGVTLWTISRADPTARVLEMPLAPGPVGESSSRVRAGTPLGEIHPDPV